MKHCLFAVLYCGVMITGPSGGAQTVLVRDGESQSEIVVAEDPSRTTLLAAKELQNHLRKISGADVPIVTQPGPDHPVKIYVGASRFTERLGFTPDDLKYGAYRIASGDSWLVLIGDDTEFSPVEPWPRSHNDIRSGRMQKEWNKITGAHWGYTHTQLHKHYSGRNALFGTPEEQQEDENGDVQVWTFDERGSFNAVTGLLRDLGVRWYMPGEIGEVIPELKTIEVPTQNRVVRPDFPMRILNFRPAVYGRDVMMWGFRLGVRQPFGRQAAHGLDRMTHNEQTFRNHPDWFALYGGKRQNQSGLRLNQLCYSNEELLNEAVRFAQVQFDHYDMDVVSIMPPDGYTAICQCPLCAGKESPHLGPRGLLSNYVWGFVNEVAKRVARTHPDKKISNCAYGVYTTPPESIKKLEPNVQVIIVGGRRPTQADRNAITKLRTAWTAKTDNAIEIFENYPFTGRGFYLPAFIPGVLGDSINATKGISRGEDIWLTMDFSENAVGFNHYLAYFTARMYWGGKEADAVRMFDEYCRLFYGPAGEPMRDFFSYCERHWREMETDSQKAGTALKLFAVAQREAPVDSIYAERLQLVDNYLAGLKNKLKLLDQKRGPVPVLRLVSGDRGQVVVDGILNDRPWVQCPSASTGRLRELQTGMQPVFGTTIRAAWIGNDLYFGIRCEEDRQSPVNVATNRNGDQSIWYGDVVEIMLSTDAHDYYQIAFNPAGALIDLDRATDRSRWFTWSSQAEVATHSGGDYWTAEIRIPVTSDANDPLHQVIGRKPTQSLPWHINICRQRLRENGTEYSAFAPTASAGFHKPMKFAHFYAGQSHKFSADETVSDYIIDAEAAETLIRKRDDRRAMQAYVSLAEDGKSTELQASVALSMAIGCAKRLKDTTAVTELTDRIPLDAVRKTVIMETMLASRDYAGIADRFGKEDLARWPFWQAGAAAFARGRAFAALGNGRRADIDYKQAMRLISDSRERTKLNFQIGQNFQNNLSDDKAALQAYRRNYESRSRIGAADEFRSLQNAVRILSRLERHEEAIATIDLVDADQLTGYWRTAMMLTRGDALHAAGRATAADLIFRAVLKEPSASNADRKHATEMLGR